MAEIIPNRVPCGNNKGDKKPEVTSVPVKQIHGITYFKLQSDYPGDYTKNCGLLGSEIDENFFFLRSNDIKTGYTEEIDTRRYLVLVKVDDEEIRIDITDNDEYKFRVEDGYITVIFPDGHEEKMGDAEGNPVRFLVEGDNVHIVTDSSLQGDGSYGNPVGVDLAYRTGTYAPADFYADLTCTAVTLNDLPPIGYGHGIVTKEDVSRFGALYTWDQAHKIDEALAAEGRGWRLPTKEDWAKLLNWAEFKEWAKDHDTDKSGNFGCIAGNRLKSMEYWDTVSDPETKPVDDFGMSIYPVGICPEDYNTQEPTQYGFTGLYKVTSFWTSSICDVDGEPYIRTFSYGHNDVAQFTENRKKRLSIRLVRDIDGDFDIADYAEILGDYVPVKLTTDGKQLWTSVNISVLNYDGFNQNEVTIPEEWKSVNTDVEAVGYFKRELSGDTYYYDFDVVYEDYELPSYINPEEMVVYNSFDEVPDPTSAMTDEFVAVKYIIHLDMITEAKFYYNAWDGNQWHKKVIREGESVVILREDYETGCDTAATPYVTSANTNHEWRVYMNPQTGLDELIDTVEALKREMNKELNELKELISGMSEDLSALSGTVADMYDEMQSGFTSAFTAIDEAKEEIDTIEEAVGLSSAGTFETIRESGITAEAETIADAIGLLDDALVETIENLDVLSGVVEDLVAEVDVLEEEVDNVEDAVGLSSAGTYVMKTDTHYLNSATTVEGEIAELDDVVFSAMTEIEELQNKTISAADDSVVVEVSGYDTTIRVQISENEDHMKLSDGTVIDYVDPFGHIVYVPKGLYFDGDFHVPFDGDADEEE